MDTIIKDTLSQHKIMLDQNCKLMISHEEMLSIHPKKSNLTVPYPGIEFSLFNL